MCILIRFVSTEKTTRIASRASCSPYRGHFPPFGGLFATLFLHVGAFLLRFSPYRGLFCYFSSMCVVFFWAWPPPPPYENFCGRPPVAYLGFHFGGDGGVQLIVLKSGVVAWREKFLKRVVYINLITFVAAYIVAGGGVEG